jgi:hypothetical protein
MTRVRTTHRSFRLFRFPTIPFHLLLVIALALDGLTAYAETPIGSVPSHAKPLSGPAVVAKVRPSVVTILTRGVPTTPTQAQSGSGSGVGGVLRHYYPVGQHQIYNLGDFWHSLRPSGDQPTLQLTVQRRNAQSTISLQNPSVPKAVP